MEDLKNGFPCGRHENAAMIFSIAKCYSLFLENI